MAVTRLRGDLGTIHALKKKLREIPLSVAHEVAPEAARYMTHATLDAFDSGETVYGDARPLGSNGKPLELVRTGATREALQFVANGTVIRCVLGPKYSRFLIGKYRILPMGAMPADWQAALRSLFQAAISRKVAA